MGERWPMGLALAWVTGCGPPLEGNWTGECRADDDFELEFDLQEEDTDTRYAGDGTATWPDGESLPLTISINLCRGAPVCHTLMGDIEPGEASVWIGIESWGTIETVADKAGRSLRGKCTFANDLILRKRAFSG